MADLAGFYQRVAALVGRPAPHVVVPPVSVPALVSLDGNIALLSEAGDVDVTNGSDGAGHADGGSEANRGTLVPVITAPYHPHLLWVEGCLKHLSSHALAISGPASLMAEQRRLPWWR